MSAATGNLTSLSRVGTRHILSQGIHSHIRGLGVDLYSLNELPDADVKHGMVGQVQARRAAALVARLIKENKIVGKAVLIAGKRGSGKTALARGAFLSFLGIAESVGESIPFVPVSASEFSSPERSKSESLIQALRKAVGVEIYEEAEVVEGEVVELVIDQSKAKECTGRLTMKTTDMEAIYELGLKLTGALLNQRVLPGDIVSIDRHNNTVTKRGRSSSGSLNFDSQGEVCTTAFFSKTHFIPCPDGELQKTVTKTHLVSLHEIDIINSHASGSSIFSGDIGEIKMEVRAQIDEKVRAWIKEGKAKIRTGVLLIDEVCMLDIESYSFLNRAIESEFSPAIILTAKQSMREQSTARIPHDFLERLVIIRAQPLGHGDLLRIIQLRCFEEDVKIHDSALHVLADVAMHVSLRHALLLISVSDVIRGRRKAQLIQQDHIEHARTLFTALKYRA